MIELPFTAREFFDLFGRYNQAVWPAQYALLGIAALVVIKLVQREHSKVVLSLLALMWVWMALVYHLVFFARINPAAPIFGVLFLWQAALLLQSARQPVARSGGLGGTLGVRLGKSLVAYALVGYPIISYLTGDHYPNTPTFGAPCPTTIFTLGVLWWYPSRLRWPVMVIPLIWAVIGTAAATELSVVQDYGLTVAGVASLLLLACRPVVLARRRVHVGTVH
jgi:hypothetical protein